MSVGPLGSVAVPLSNLSIPVQKPDLPASAKDVVARLDAFDKRMAALAAPPSKGVDIQA